VSENFYGRNEYSLNRFLVEDIDVVGAELAGVARGQAGQVVVPGLERKIRTTIERQSKQFKRPEGSFSSGISSPREKIMPCLSKGHRDILSSLKVSAFPPLKADL
jgi:hypothetical protein